jgi:hypothetical protein
LFNLALAVGADSVANTTPQVDGGSSNFDLAAAWFGGYAWASDGNFQLANAVLTGNERLAPGYFAGSYAQYGSFNLARAIGMKAYANAGSSEVQLGYGSFNLARALGPGAGACAGGYLGAGGFFNITRALGSGAQGFAGNPGTNDPVPTQFPSIFNISRALGSNSIAQSYDGSFNRARALGPDTTVNAQVGNFNTARAFGRGSTATAGGTTAFGDFNWAAVIGANSTGTAGPGNFNRALVLGSGQTKTNPPTAASSTQDARVRSASTRNR